jgi:membrane protein involved in colicin uptake
MPKYTVLDPIKRGGKRREIGSTLDLSAEQAKPLLLLGVIAQGTDQTAADKAAAEKAAADKAAAEKAAADKAAAEQAAADKAAADKGKQG